MVGYDILGPKPWRSPKTERLHRSPPATDNHWLLEYGTMAETTQMMEYGIEVLGVNMCKGIRSVTLKSVEIVVYAGDDGV